MWKKILGKVWRKTPILVRRGATRLAQSKFTVSVGAIVTNAEGKVLLLDHVLRPASGWGIPGGFIGTGEQPEKALRRELCEETGLEIESVELCRVRTFHRHVEILFRARARGAGEIRSFEINKIGWFEVDRMPPEMSQLQKKLIEEVLADSEKK